MEKIVKERALEKIRIMLNEMKDASKTLSEFESNIAAKEKELFGN